MERYTKRDAEKAFERLLTLTGKHAGPWNEVGAWQLDYNGTYGGYVVVEITSEGGGQTHPLGDMRRNARDFCSAVNFASRVDYVIDKSYAVADFECRDIGYGVETGTVLLPALDAGDWTGKRAYATPDGETVYLFDDEMRPRDWSSPIA